MKLGSVLQGDRSHVGNYLFSWTKIIAISGQTISKVRLSFHKTKTQRYKQVNNTNQFHEADKGMEGHCEDTGPLWSLLSKTPVL